MTSSHDQDASAPGRRPVPTPVEVPRLNGVLIALTNVPDEDSAREIAEALVRERFAACVNILSGCTSIYRWLQEVETAEEIPLLIKTTIDRFAALQARLSELHPYDVPELIAWRPDAVMPAYANWVISETRNRRPAG